MRAWANTIYRFVKAAGKAIAPSNNSWKELRIRASLVDQLLSLKTFVLVYIGGLALVFALMVPSLSVSMGYMPGINGAAMRAAIGFNALFIVSIFTVSAVATVSLVALLRSLGVVLFPIDFREHLKQLAAYVGYGTLTGVIAAALTPIATAILRQPSTPPLSPSLLIDLPAAGAIGGYVVGLVALSLSLGKRSSNKVYRHLLFPALFLGLFVTVYKVGLTPEMLFQETVVNTVDFSGISDSFCLMSEDDKQIQAHLSDPLWLLTLADRCGGSAVVAGARLVSWVLVTVPILAIVGFLRGVWQSMKSR